MLFDPLPRVLNCGNPVNRTAPLNRGLVDWFVILPQFSGGYLMRNACDATRHAKLTAGSAYWSRSGLKRPSGYGSFYDTAVTMQPGFTKAKRLDACTAFTVSCWIRIRTGLGANDSFFGTWDIGPVKQQFSRFSSGMQWFMRNNADSAEASITIASASISTNAWHHFVFTADGANLNAYLDGASAASAVALTGPYLKTGSGLWYWTYGRTKGSGCPQDDLRHYDRALTGSEVRQLYDASRTGYQRELNWLDRPWLSNSVAGGATKYWLTRRTTHVIGGGIS